MLFEKSGNFSQSDHRDRFDSSPPPVCFHSIFKEPLPPPQQTQGFPQVLRTWRGSSKFDGKGLSQYMGGAWREDEDSVEKYLWWSSFDSKVAGYKPASLKIY